MKAILLSGGVDSTALAFMLRPERAYTIDYGQRSFQGELRAARIIAQRLGILHELISVDCRSLGSGDLAGTKALSVAPAPEWWPFRNQLLITLAAMKGVGQGITTFLLGAVSTDGCHSDGTQAFVDQMDRLLRMQEGSLRLKAPAIRLTTVELIKESKIPLSLLAWTHSCHTGPYACGTCRGCVKRANVLRALGL